MPIFARRQISDLRGFELHLERLMGLLPEDGETLDLRPLLRRLVGNLECLRIMFHHWFFESEDRSLFFTYGANDTIA